MRQAVQTLTDAGFQAEVVVVDNRSVDGSCAMVRAQFPEVELIALEENVGFSCGNNVAMRNARGRWVLLLNPDTVIPEDSLLKALRYADEKPRLGGMGVPMVDGQGRFLPESKRGLPSPWAAFCKITGLYRVAPRSKSMNRYYQGHLPRDISAPIEILSGAFMWLRKEALDQVGLLDESYFMYGEDVDLSWRLIQGGWENHYFAGTSIIHYKGESTKKGSLNYVLVFYRAMLIFSQTHFGGSSGQILIRCIKLAIYFRAAIAIGGQALRRWGMGVLEIMLLVSGMLGLLHVYSLQSGIQYDLWLAIPAILVYSIVWAVSVFLCGGYDRPWRPAALIRGVFWGALVLLAAYGLLPEELRFSRAILLLSTVWSLVVFLGLRRLHGQQHWQSQRAVRRIYIAAPDELIRLVALVEAHDPDSPVEGRKRLALAPGPNTSEHSITGMSGVRYVGTAEDLNEALRVHRVNEVVLSGSELAAWRIIDLMSGIADESVNFRIARSDQGPIMGSGGPELAPITELGRSIHRPASRRAKRIFDGVAAVGVVAFSPIFLLTGRLKWTSWALRVAIGKATWVGFSHLADGVPQLKPHLLNRSNSEDFRVQQRMNLTYARDYRWTIDLGVIREALISRSAIHRHGNN